VRSWRGELKIWSALLQEALGPWDSGRRYLNFTESRIDPATLYSPASYERLQAIKTRVDPGWTFRANHSIPPAGTPRRSAPRA
jgi:hypothetical protein